MPWNAVHHICMLKANAPLAAAVHTLTASVENVLGKQNMNVAVICVICLLGVCCQSLDYDAAAVEELEQVRQQEAAQVRSAKEAVEVLAAQLSALDFTYRCARALGCMSRVVVLPFPMGTRVEISQKPRAVSNQGSASKQAPWRCWHSRR